MMTFVYIGLFIIVAGAIIGGILTFLPSGVLMKMEERKRERSEN